MTDDMKALIDKLMNTFETRKRTEGKSRDTTK